MGGNYKMKNKPKNRMLVCLVLATLLTSFLFLPTTLGQYNEKAIEQPRTIGFPEQNEIQKLIASDGTPHDYFGTSVAVDGDFMIIGAPLNEENGYDAGAVYIYEYDGETWNEVQQILGQEFAQLGGAVDIEGNVAVIGAIGDDWLRGGVYIYRYDGSTWNQEQLLTDDIVNNAFGNAVSLVGDKLLIGAEDDNTNGQFAGAAYIYHYIGTTWVEKQKLIGSDTESSDGFGRSVAVDDDVLIIGADYNDGAVNRSGSAYIYRYNGASWTEEQKLIASNGEQGDYFGSAVAIENNEVVIGAPQTSNGGKGIVYIFKDQGETWEEIQIIETESSFAYFGYALARRGNSMIIGACKDEGHGTAYLYRTSDQEWIEEEKYVASDAAYDDKFGSSVAIDDNVVLIGAPDENNQNGEEAGSAYVFEMPKLGDIDGDGDVDTADLLALLAAWGNPGGPEDLNSDGIVNTADLLILLGNWG